MVTFTLDDLTVRQLRRTAAQAGRPQSQVVRAAIQEYASRAGRLSEQERLRFLRAFDTLVPKIPTRPQAEVKAELRALRAARRRGGRRHPVP
jgi:hypothetical protein